jgi:hypothetical protein
LLHYPNPEGASCHNQEEEQTHHQEEALEEAQEALEEAVVHGASLGHRHR